MLWYENTEDYMQLQWHTNSSHTTETMTHIKTYNTAHAMICQATATMFDYTTLIKKHILCGIQKHMHTLLLPNDPHCLRSHWMVYIRAPRMHNNKKKKVCKYLPYKFGTGHGAEFHESDATDTCVAQVQRKNSHKAKRNSWSILASTKPSKVAIHTRSWICLPNAIIC